LDQSAKLAADLWPATAWAGSPPPIKTEAGTVPADHGVGHDDNQNFSPAGPTMAKNGPEEAVQAIQFWPRPFSFEHGDLLLEGQLRGRYPLDCGKHSDADKE